MGNTLATGSLICDWSTTFFFVRQFATTAVRSLPSPAGSTGQLPSRTMWMMLAGFAARALRSAWTPFWPMRLFARSTSRRVWLACTSRASCIAPSSQMWLFASESLRKHMSPSNRRAMTTAPPQAIRLSDKSSSTNAPASESERRSTLLCSWWQ